MAVTDDASGLTREQWDAYQASIVEPNSRPNRPFGAYATDVRKIRHHSLREQIAAAG